MAAGVGGALEAQLAQRTVQASAEAWTRFHTGRAPMSDAGLRRRRPSGVSKSRQAGAVSPQSAHPRARMYSARRATISARRSASSGSRVTSRATWLLRANHSRCRTVAHWRQ